MNRLIVECAAAFASQLDRPYLRRLVSTVLSGEGVGGDTELSLVITDDAGIQEINRQYRGVDRATDVLAFSLLPTGGDVFITPPGQPRQLGDIVISFERAAAQAKELGHSVRQEIAELFVHGLLHILGYDHENPEDAAVMAGKAEQYLSEYPHPEARQQEVQS